jgi:hypothetical protein
MKLDTVGVEFTYDARHHQYFVHFPPQTLILLGNTATRRPSKVPDTPVTDHLS